MNKIIIIKILISLFIFIFNPIIAVLLVTIQALKTRQYTYNNVYVFTFIGIILMSFVNMVKIPENDLENYIYYYHNAQSYNFFDYLKFGGQLVGEWKEPAYTTFAYILNYICVDNEYIYKFLYTSINYFLLCKSVYIFSKEQKDIPIYYCTLGIAFMFFIPYIFTMSLQIMRQFFAGSLLIYNLSRISFDNKRNKIYDYIIILIMVLMHTTSLIFVPFLLLPYFEKSIKYKNNWFFFGIILSIIVGIRFVSGLLLKIGFGSNLIMVNDALNRASQKTTFELESLGPIQIIMIIFIILLCYFLSYKSKFSTQPGMMRYCHLWFFITIFILINLDQTELSGRFLFYVYPAVPILLISFLAIIRIKPITTILIAIGLIIFWGIYLEIGTWTYDIPFSIWLTPIFLY